MYIYGVRDCFTLAVDYYKREFDINIAHRAKGYPEISNWVDGDDDLLVDNYIKAGFVDVTGQDHEVGDLLLIQMSKKTDHVAIYVGDDRILHHCIGRLSKTDIYGGGYWQKHTTHHLRWHAFAKEVK
jgi:cell wall-associated NlpC family hydrolase